jgi:hypothetical protein
MAIKISNHEDWSKLTGQGLKTVVDPMVFRSGELFLKGSKGVDHPEETYELLNKNIQAIGMFCDSMVLNEKLPVFNYGDTFDGMLNFDQRTLTQINDKEEVLYDVDVEYGVYHDVKSSAIDELHKLFEGEKKIKSSVANDVLSELYTSGYSWNPSIEVLEERLNSDSEKKLAAFLMGGLIFTGYAQIMESEHLIQPKRSRIILALGMGEATDFAFENRLFDELKARAGSQYEDLPWVPTFFPYLLHKTETSQGLIEEIVKLRKSPAIKDYRSWFNEAIQDFKDNGRISTKKINNVKSIANHIDKVTGKVSSLPKVEFKVSIADVLGVKIPLGLDLSPTLSFLWGWFLQNIPGRRYRKILTRAVIKDSEYIKIENRIKKIWSA